MQNSQLYINDHPLDLPSDSLIALSYAVNTLTDVTTVQGNISNSITLPNTANNRAALGYPDDMNFNGAGIIRKKLPCRYIQNGVDVIAQGNLRITGATKSGINVVLSCGNTDFFDVITGKITDLRMDEHDHIWNHANVIASRINPTAYVYPIINYGTLLPSGDEGHSSGVYTNEMRPAVFARYIVKKIVESAGYTLDDQAVIDDNVTQPIYSNLLLPFSGDKMSHPQRYINDLKPKDVKATNTGQSHSSANGELVPIPFTNEVTDTDNRFDGTRWTANRIMRINISAAMPHIHLHRPSGSGGGTDSVAGAYFKIMHQPAGSGTANIMYEQNLRFGPAHDDEDHNDVHLNMQSVAMWPGDSIFIAYETAGHDVNTTVTIDTGATLNINADFSDIIYGEILQLEGTLPDMSCTDFLRFIQFYFCAVIQTDNVKKTVKIVPFGHIIQNMPLALDWSSKITNGDDEFDVQIGDYCQQNEAKWQPDDNISPDTYANGSFKITDDNLDLYQDIYDLPFAPSYDVLSLASKLKTIAINKVPDIYQSSEFTIQTENRICLLNTVNTQLIYYDTNGSGTTITDNIPLTFFSSGSADVPDLTLPSIFNNHYKDLVTVLNDQRKLTCYLRLTEMDIQQLNFFIPIYIQKYASYFYISKITDFTGVKPVKVELIRL
ncbi:MAG: hypothetical protein ABIN91_06775 [Mucilaginibacter sp.]|uniref:hypothetical protein n=1 Tax=Mucilaginibacter sp. TaxID=1882438 RepID=UPI00326639C8